MRKLISVGWKLATLSADVASIRYRALLPIIALDEERIHSVIFSDCFPEILEEIDVLVLVKSLTLNDLLLAQSAAEKGIPVIFDLCDNIFIEGYGTKARYRPADIFAHLVKYLSAIVTTTEPLAQVIRHRIDDAIPIYVVPDGIETEHLLRLCQKKILAAKNTQNRFNLNGWFKWKDKLSHRISLLKGLAIGQLVRKRVRELPEKILNSVCSICKKLRKEIKKTQFRHFSKKPYNLYRYCQALLQKTLTHINPATISCSKIASTECQANDCMQDVPCYRILWFGHHGASYACFGMLDILLMKEALETIALESPCELIVVSNNKKKFLENIDSMAIPTRYIEWSASTMESYIRSADVVIIPNSKDAFSICKSTNRAVLALSNGIPVVGTGTPALEQLKECIWLDDFVTGLRKYRSDRQFARAHVVRGQQLISELYGQEVIGHAWFNIIREVIGNHAPAKRMQPEFIIVLNLIQEIDLALPVLQAATKRGIRTEIWFNSSSLFESARTEVLLGSQSEGWRIFPARLEPQKIRGLFKGVKYLLSVSESNLLPHQFTHKITRIANQAGIETATMQHGFENIGLTYSDEIHAIKKIRIVSNRIYIWGPLSTLHPAAPASIRDRCMPVGRPYLSSNTNFTLFSVFPHAKEIVVIFENLHWHRYSDAFKSFFIEGLNLAAEAFPEYIFLLKPHPAGLWSAKNGRKIAFDRENIVTANPSENLWSNLSAKEILSGGALAAITTPSTVALEAASLGMQVAITEHIMNCQSYEPLSKIKTLQDWIRFIEHAASRQGREDNLKLNRQFLRRVLVPANSAELIIEDLMDGNGQK